MKTFLALISAAFLIGCGSAPKPPPPPPVPVITVPGTNPLLDKPVGVFK
jgi:hypothetical protein